MAEALVFIEDNQGWIYFLLALASLAYLRTTLRWYLVYRRAMFSLERERASVKLASSAAMLALSLTLIASTFVVATFAAPAVPASIRPTPAPTVSVLVTPTLPGEGTAQAFTTATPLPTVAVDTSGCLNPLATLTSPKDGDTLSGVVDIEGTANIPNFAFWKYEYIRREPGAVWRTIQAGTNTVVKTGLGSWDTSLVVPGDYLFRLVVTDVAGNAPLPCMIQLRVTAGP